MELLHWGLTEYLGSSSPQRACTRWKGRPREGRVTGLPPFCEVGWGGLITGLLPSGVADSLGACSRAFLFLKNLKMNRG